MSKGSISVNMIFVVFASLIAIVILLVLVGKNIPLLSNILYCRGIAKVSNIGFFPYQLRATVQDKCDQTKEFNVVVLKERKISINTFSNSTSSILIDTVKSDYFEIPNGKIDSAFITAYNNDDILVNLEVFVANQLVFKEDIIPNNEKKIDITTSISNAMASCTQNICNVNIVFNPSTDAILVVKDVDIKYFSCTIKEEIISHMLACWEKVSYGHYSEDYTCFELQIPENCFQQPENFPESEVTNFMLQSANYCDLLSNSDYGCGDEDKVEWELLQLRNNQNILIEFDSQLNKIHVI